MVAAMSSTDRASSQPPSIHWNGQASEAELGWAVKGDAEPMVQVSRHTAPASTYGLASTFSISAMACGLSW